MSYETAAPVVREAQWPADADTLRTLRSTVFIEEQGVPQHIEWDGFDEACRHVIAEIDEQAIGCGRLMPDGRIGRLAVLPAHRGSGVGAALLRELLQLARASGLGSVYLHAQATAIAFYERAGFSPRGEMFKEAGIDHLDMLLHLDYSRWNTSLSNVRFPHPFGDLVAAQAHHTQRELRILSPQLHPSAFEGDALREALLRLAKGGARTQVKVIIKDVRAVTQRGHRLLELARRLPSTIALRCLAEHASWNDEQLVLRDQDGILRMPAADRGHGSYRVGDRARGRNEILFFEELWSASSSHPDLRALAM